MAKSPRTKRHKAVAAGTKARASSKVDNGKLKSEAHQSKKRKKPSEDDNNDENGDNCSKWSKSKKKRMRRFLAASAHAEHHRGDNGQMDHFEEAFNMSGSKNKPGNRKAAEAKGKKHDNVVVADKSPASKKLKSNLQQSFMERLSASRFRELNEQLYTTTSKDAFRKFSRQPELFEQYHAGYRQQVKQWPVNPLDIVRNLVLAKERESRKKRGAPQHRVSPNDTVKKRKNKKKKKTGSDETTKESDVPSPKLVVADFGCGDADLAKSLLSVAVSEKDSLNKDKTNEDDSEKDTTSDCPFVVHSFDLVSGRNPLVTACDMANVPLEPNTVDIGVFCLSLMGTNIADFIREAHRVLTKDGTLLIAEVRSRFESSSCPEDDDDDGDKKEDFSRNAARGGKSSQRSHPAPQHSSKKDVDESLFQEFLSVMDRLGFRCVRKDRSNTMFVLMEFVKKKRNGNQEQVPDVDAQFTAKPCIYKRR